MCDKERQEDEIEVLESIFPQELSVMSKWPACGCLKISPSLVTENMMVKIITKCNGKSEEKLINVKYLPPVELFFMCPKDYPSNSEPLFILNSLWLPDELLTQICHKFDDLWDSSKCEILFSWASFLKEDCISFLKLDELNITLNMDCIKQMSFEVTDKDSDTSLNKINISRKNIHLRELMNKTMNDKYDSEIWRKRENNSVQKRMKRHKHLKKIQKQNTDKICFKYETPKDIEKKGHVPNRIISLQKDYDQSPGNSESEKDNFHKLLQLKTESILNVINVYGKRSKFYSEEVDTRILSKTLEVTTIVNQIIEHNDNGLDAEFRSCSHFCNICFETKVSSACVCIKPCRHVFCKDCVRDYLTVNIHENQVKALSCLESTCDTIISSYQIKQNVDDTSFKKYENFSLNMVIQNDPTLLYCPRKFCQGVARLTDLNRGLCHCEQCAFYFCLFCKKSFHGVNVCKFKSEERKKVLQEYRTASASKRAELEKRFSKQEIHKWIEEEDTEKMIRECSEPCPNCGAMIEKNSGCNKMLCSNCNTPFCWLCKICLIRSNPYSHYQIKDSPCYQKLYPFIDEEDDFELFDFEENFEEEFEDELYFYLEDEEEVIE